MHRRFRSFLTASGTRAACILAALACGAALRAGELASADLRPLFARWGLDARRQGKRGTCSVFVITGAIEFAKAKTRGSSERLSVEFLNWAANVTHGDQKDGGFFADLWNGFTAHGICPEEDMPYRDEFDPKREPGEFARDQGSQAHALGLGLRWIKAWNPRKGVNAAQLAEIKRTLLRGWPVAGGFLWPKDPQWDDGVLRMCPRPEVRDGHSVLLVGFVDDPVKPGGGTFIIRDSNRDAPDERLTYGPGPRPAAAFRTLRRARSSRDRCPSGRCASPAGPSRTRRTWTRSTYLRWNRIGCWPTCGGAPGSSQKPRGTAGGTVATASSSPATSPDTIYRR